MASEERLLSLDALRGATIAAMILVNNPGSWAHVYRQLDHAEWNGWTFTDLIFPFFLFIVGISIVLSMARKRGAPRREVYPRVLRRAALLFALGLFLNGFPNYDLPTIRVMGVLQRISLCYLATAVAYLELGAAGLAALSAALCAAYWALMAWYPVPGVGAGAWEKGRNFAAYVDQLTLGRHVWAAGKTWDPEGLVSTLPAIANTIFGCFAGLWLRCDRPRPAKAAGLLAAGAAAALAGWLWSFALPINKNLWTPSYAVFMSGLCLLALAAFYWTMDVKGRSRWAHPLVVYGSNAIAVFVLSGLVARVMNLWKVMGPSGKPTAVKNYIYLEWFASWLGPLNGSVGFAVAFIAAMYLAMRPLYKRRIFLKV